MLNEIEFEIQGTWALLMHNGRLANPLDPWVEELSKLKGKRNKTREDHEEYAEVQWFASLYTDPEIVPGGKMKGARVVIPSENIDRMMVMGARKFKRGKQFESGVFSVEPCWPIISNGPMTDVVALSKKPQFADMRTVVIQRSRVLCCRPRFDDWSLKFTLRYTGVEEAEVRRALEIAGEVIGLCDYRPRFGRFVVVE